MEEDVAKTTEKQLGGITGKGFMPGQSGNPNGRPKGSISVIGRLKQMFEEDPEDFETFVKAYKEDANNRKHITEMIDGKPRQDIDANLKGELHINIIDFSSAKENGKI